MAHGAGEHAEVPDAVEVGPVVVGKEVGAAGIEKPFGQNEQQGGGGEVPADGHGDEDDRPSHEQIEQEGKARIFADGGNLVAGAGNHGRPQQTEYGPAQGTAHHADADGGVGGGYHDVDADVVEDAEPVLAFAGEPPVVEGAGGKHE